VIGSVAVAGALSAGAIRCSRCSVSVSAALIVYSVVLMNCASRRVDVPDYGIPPCPTAAQRDLFSSDALQCWFAGPRGRWRRVDHQSHLEALVVFVEARDVRDAETIARRLVEDPFAEMYSEILVYVNPEKPDGASRVRRVRWIRDGGFDTLEF
jgi:hypothetical protein